MAMAQCRECKTEVSDKAWTCPHCGVLRPGYVAGRTVRCRECERKISPDARTCPHCGVDNPGGRRIHTVVGLAVLIAVVLYFVFT